MINLKNIYKAGDKIKAIDGINEVIFTIKKVTSKTIKATMLDREKIWIGRLNRAGDLIKFDMSLYINI